MAEKMTVEDVIINRLTRDGMKSETYRKFINDTTIPKDIASKIMIQLEKTGTTAAQGPAPDVFTNLMNSLKKFKKIRVPGYNETIANLHPNKYAEIPVQSYIIDNKLVTPQVFKGFLDHAFSKHIDDGVKPLSRLGRHNHHYKTLIAGGGERVIPVEVPPDIYPTTTRNISTSYPQGSIDRLTARLIFLTGGRAAEMSRLEVGSFPSPEDPSYHNSKVGSMKLKAQTVKGKPVHFTDLEAYYILRARQLALRDGRTELFPNFNKVDKALTAHLINTYGGGSNGVFIQFNERLGEFVEGGNPTRVFIRNLMKDRSGSLLAHPNLIQGDNLQITMNLINNEPLETGMKGNISKYKYMVQQGAIRAIVESGMDVIDNSYLAYIGMNNAESLLVEDGVVQALKDETGKITIPETSVLTKHINTYPYTDAVLRNTYAMGWMDDTQLRNWEQFHPITIAVNESYENLTARVQQLNRESALLIDDAVSKTILNTEERLSRAAELNTQRFKEIDAFNIKLEEEKLLRKEKRLADKRAARAGDASDIRRSQGSEPLSQEDVKKEIDNRWHNKPSQRPGESDIDYETRLNKLESRGNDMIGRLDDSIKKINDFSDEAIETIFDKKTGRYIPRGAGVGAGFFDPNMYKQLVALGATFVGGKLMWPIKAGKFTMNILAGRPGLERKTLSAYTAREGEMLEEQRWKAKQKARIEASKSMEGIEREIELNPDKIGDGQFKWSEEIRAEEEAKMHEQMMKALAGL